MPLLRERDHQQPGGQRPLHPGTFRLRSDLRRHGEKIAARGGKNSKKRAAVAVARKLCVLLHSLWVSGEIYDPLYNANRRQEQEAA
jgi:transposase